MKKNIAISLRLEPEVLAFFKSKAKPGYQSLMKQVLKNYMNQEQQNLQKKAGEAQAIFRIFYSRCFWHLRKDLEITPQNMNLVIEGLRKNGGKEGLKLAEGLCR